MQSYFRKIEIATVFQKQQQLDSFYISCFKNILILLSSKYSPKKNSLHFYGFFSLGKYFSIEILLPRFLIVFAMQNCIFLVKWKSNSKPLKILIERLLRLFQVVCHHLFSSLNIYFLSTTSFKSGRIKNEQFSRIIMIVCLGHLKNSNIFHNSKILL